MDLLEKAREKIASLKTRKASPEELKNQSVELARLILEISRNEETKKEKAGQEELAGMMNDKKGKLFTTLVTDECFRSNKSSRVADQLSFIIRSIGIPNYLSWPKKLALKSFKYFEKGFYWLLVPLMKHFIHLATKRMIFPGEEGSLSSYLKKKKKEGLSVNLNRLGEAILGEEEAKNRLKTYLKDLANPEIEYISIKISTLYSQINLLAFDENVNLLSERLKILYRAAKKHPFKRRDGTLAFKFINLDMEEYKDLELTATLFKAVLDDPEFFDYSAGIVLQSYLPDSFLIQQELTLWAIKRKIQGGEPIKIRIVKGANLAMERYEASLRGWSIAPYASKIETDANYKRMLDYGMIKEHAESVHIGVASHNLFDIAYALLLRSQNEVETKVCFEMLEGMADPMRRVVQKLSKEMLVYSPAVKKREFQSAVAYLVRRLDENSAPENFLRHLFDLKPESPYWESEVNRFLSSFDRIPGLNYSPNRKQNRFQPFFEEKKSFSNDPDTDWSLPQNRRFAEKILTEWKEKPFFHIPCVIAGKEGFDLKKRGVGIDPSFPKRRLYEYSLAGKHEIDIALQAAEEAQKKWRQTSCFEKKEMLLKIAKEISLSRGELIGAMVVDAGKTVAEADVEISEAIDFATYYGFNLINWHSFEKICWKPKGTVLVATPWNFPASISAGGILAALAGGNAVIYKPSKETILVAWELVQLFWKAGIDKSLLQFVLCEDEREGSFLVQNPKINAVILTGATETARKFQKMRPDIDLMAETGGKNALIISGMSDRDLAIKDLVHSAFSHSGQKCSACSLAILEAEVYDDPDFLCQLKDAVKSLKVGPSWSLESKITPLISPPGEILMRGLKKLEPGESWLLEPFEDPENPHLWSPGIKMGVSVSGFTFQNELFGPVLGLVRAENLEKAFEMMNQTPYGLTAGIHTLDLREQAKWLEKVEAGNCYINRTITGAIVERQPFGGCKASSFGKGAKAGGPNYLLELMEIEEKGPPEEKAELPKGIERIFSRSLEEKLILKEEEEIWRKSLESYIFYWVEYFSKPHDPASIPGQDNLQCYVPLKKLVLRSQGQESFLDLARAYIAAIISNVPVEISVEKEEQRAALEKIGASVFLEDFECFFERISKAPPERVRFFKKVDIAFLKKLNDASIKLFTAPVFACGRLELLYTLREVSISRDYHRYGNLIERQAIY